MFEQEKKKRAAEKYQEVALQLRWLSCGAVVKVEEVLKCLRRPFSTQLTDTLQPLLCLLSSVAQTGRKKKKVTLVHRDTNNQSGHENLSLQRLELKP